MGKIHVALHGLINTPILVFCLAGTIAFTTSACQGPLIDFPKFHLTDAKPER